MPFKPDYEVPDNRCAYTIGSGSVGCLMLHGFMGSPTSSRPMAEYLAERGITTYCPLLPGHGSLPEYMRNIRYEAWLAEAEEAFRYLRSRCDEIFIAGHSMGTVLGAHLASRYTEVRGLIMLAPLYKPPSRLIGFLRALRYVLPWFYPWRLKKLRRLTTERILDLYPELDMEDPEVQSWLIKATRVPTGAIDEMRKVADRGRLLWPHLRLPVLIFQGGKDIAVKAGYTERIYELLGSEKKALYTFPDAGHELMRPFEPVHKEVWSKIYDFICEHAKGEARLIDEAVRAT